MLGRIFKTPNYKKSFAQNGEDIIIDNMLKWLGCKQPTYIDIGTYDPTVISNTHLLYKQNFNGVCVEPNPMLVERIKKLRPRDICLNVAVGSKPGHATFYIMENATLSTLSEEQAELCQSSGQSKIQKKIPIELMTIEQIIENVLHGRVPQFINLDIEGLDLEVLQSFDFKKYRPQVWCVESKDSHHNKNVELIRFMESNGYFVGADTHINSIFVDNSSWQNRPL